MGMLAFQTVFPEVATRETRSVVVFEPRGHPDDATYLPPDEYGFIELYCNERGCDCRRVMFNVVVKQGAVRVATINHAFEKPTPGDVVSEQTFLDPLNLQGPHALGALDLLEDVVLADATYCARLERHYAMFKRVVDDVAHPLHRLIRGDAPAPSGKQRIIPPPPRRGRRRRGW